MIRDSIPLVALKLDAYKFQRFVASEKRQQIWELVKMNPGSTIETITQDKDIDLDIRGVRDRVDSMIADLKLAPATFDYTQFKKRSTIMAVNDLLLGRTYEKLAKEIYDSWRPIPEEELKAELQKEVAKSCADLPETRKKRLELAPKKPTIVQVIRTEYRRNSDVVAEVMIRAAGICEGCFCKAPFIRASDGTPYLEVHHVLPLAEGGDDTVENAEALCPNCHRRKHFGSE